MSKIEALDPKAVVVHQAGHIAREWQVRLPPNVPYGDLFNAAVWTGIEKLMRNRGGVAPRKDDLIRCLGNGFDVLCRVEAIADGYKLTYYAGQRPPPLPQILADLDALPRIDDPSELKDCVKRMRLRWQAVGATKEDLSAARRRFAQQNHPDTTNATNAPRLATANALLDAALENLTETA
jgi:hypothetical protein